MRKCIWPVKVFDPVPDRTPAFLHALVLLALLGSSALAREGPKRSTDDGNVHESCSTDAHSADVDEPLRAFQTPSREGVELAVTRIYLVLAIAGLGLILFFLGAAYYYQPNSWRETSEPTEVKRAPGVVLQPRQRESESRRWELLDE